MQQHPFKVGDTVYQYVPNTKECVKLNVIGMSEFPEIEVVNADGDKWHTDPELLSFFPYDFKSGGWTWERQNDKYKDHGWFWEKDKTHFVFDKLLKSDDKNKMYMSSSDCIWRPFFSKETPDFIMEIMSTCN